MSARIGLTVQFFSLIEILLICLIPLDLHWFHRSDVLGQFMPLVGVDWSQTGVTHLFSAIKV